jgi:hypothetical protein
MLELLRHVGTDQARALCFAAGTSIAVENRLVGVDKLGEMEQIINAFLKVRDWGWMRVEEHEDAVDFLHGCSPLRAWFGEECLGWAAALFEGLYAEWLRQLGAGERLELRQVDAPKGDDDLVCFRLMHESRFTA